MEKIQKLQNKINEDRAIIERIRARAKSDPSYKYANVDCWVVRQEIESLMKEIEEIRRYE